MPQVYSIHDIQVPRPATSYVQDEFFLFNEKNTSKIHTYNYNNRSLMLEGKSANHHNGQNVAIRFLNF